MTERKSFVYFLQAEIGGPIKIGFSYRPQERLREMMAWSPFPLVLLAKGDGGKWVEVALHREFAANRSHGEWFTPCADLLRLIEETKKTGRVPSVGGMVDLSWRVGPTCDWASNLGPVLAKLGCTRRELAEAIGVSLGCAQSWCTYGVSDFHLPAVIAFAAERGLHLTPQDLFTQKPRSLRDAA